MHWILASLWLVGCGIPEGPLEVTLRVHQAGPWRPAFLRMVADWWDYADQDRDGTVSPAEASRGGMKMDRFQRYDLDQSGSLSRSEMDATYGEFVALIDFSSQRALKLDRNQDGALTHDEFQPDKFQVRPAPWCPEPRADIQDLAWQAADQDGNAALSAAELPGFLVYFLERSYMLRIVTPLLV